MRTQAGVWERAFRLLGWGFYVLTNEPHPLAIVPYLEDNEFLHLSLCNKLAAEARRYATDSATTSLNGRNVVDRNVRRANWAAISSSLLRDLTPIFNSALMKFSQYFGIQLTRFQEPHLIRYLQGDFHGPHVDSFADSHDPYQAKITCLVFLNTQGGQMCDSFEGGYLVVHELSPHVHATTRRRIVNPGKGKMVAFRSSLCHQVLPVTKGERFTLATWYF